MNDNNSKTLIWDNIPEWAIYWRSLKVPWNNPILAKDSTYPIQEEWNISNAM